DRQKTGNHVTPQQSWLAAAAAVAAARPAEPAAPSEAPEEGRLLSWPGAREELSCQIQLKLFYRQGRSLSASAVEDTERNVESPHAVKRGDAAMQGETAARQPAGGEECRAKRRLDKSGTANSRTRAAQAEALPSIRPGRNLPSCLATSHLPSCLLSFLTRRLEQADRLDPWLKPACSLNVRQILETASSTSFATDCPSSQSGFQIPARSQR
uniref:Zinc finger, C3HC4 type (RING finger) domain-containing protein n=1 Tax=Macrostomum lignano TaxID=282301 RepID=A0A1I8FCI2_9PLAT